ncbi:MAG TPA: hypothetical protein DCX17_04670 [Firmicutes bacterium]|nr:hypothetical protein [Bacillota bacterium]
MTISQRLRAIANLVPSRATPVDIGSDHGHVLDLLLSSGKIIKGYATDNKTGPFHRLEKRFEHEPRIKVYKADGLTNLPDDVDTLIITGMGGLLINQIIEQGTHFLDNISSIIVGPHQQVYEVRRDLSQLGFMIVAETIVAEDYQFYDLLRFEPGIAEYREQELSWGPINLKTRSPILLLKMRQRIEEIDRILKKPIPAKRIAALKKEMAWLQHYDQNK